VARTQGAPVVMTTGATEDAVHGPASAAGRLKASFRFDLLAWIHADRWIQA
jgi:hypothetical protein